MKFKLEVYRTEYLFFNKEAKKVTDISKLPSVFLASRGLKTAS